MEVNSQSFLKQRRANLKSEPNAKFFLVRLVIDIKLFHQIFLVMVTTRLKKKQVDNKGKLR